MNTKTNGKLETVRTMLGAFLAIAACAALFSGLSERALASELGKQEVVPTSYTAAAPVAAEKDAAPKGYQKADYRTAGNPLPYYADKKPTGKDISKERAAELGAQAIWEIWQADLNGATIYMGYDPASESYPRATWSGDVRYGELKKPDGTPGLDGYFFTLDAVTGEMNTAGLSRTLAVEAPLDYDAALASNPGAYTAMARELAEKHGFVQGKVKASEYNGQGYAGNDPEITVYVTGEDGGTAALTFSRYDKQFTGLIYPESLRITEAVNQQFLAEIEKGIAKQREGFESGSANASPDLTALQ